MFERVAKAADLNPGRGKTFDLRGTKIAVFNVDGTFHAIHNTCPHRQGPLGDGDLKGTKVSCPWHGWKFDVTTGQFELNADVCVPRFECRVEGDDLLVCPEPAARE